MLGRIPLSKLDPDDVERMTDEIVARGRSPQTARHARATLRLALADARAKRLIPDNAASLARPPILEEKEMEFLTVVEVRALLAACEDDERVGAIVTLAVMTGMRQGEILGATWPDINLDNGTIRVRQQLVQDEGGAFVLGPTKTAKSRRTVSLPAPAAAALRRERARQDERRRLAGSAWQGADDLAFTDELGRPLKRWNVSDDFNALLARGGLRRIRFHDLRHTAASQMLAAGTPLQEVSRVLGHSTIVMMNRYTHFEPEKLRAAASNYERLLSEGA
jgi:integrase